MSCNWSMGIAEVALKTISHTRSHNHSMAKVGRPLWALSHPTSLLKQGYLQLVAQDCDQVTFEDLKEWRLHSFSLAIAGLLASL